MSWWPFHISKWHPYIHTSIHPSSIIQFLRCVQIPSSLFTANLQVWGRVLWSNATKNATKIFLSARWDLLPDADVWNDQLWPHGSTTATSTGFLTPIAGCTTIATHGNVHDNFPEKQASVFETEGSLTSCFRLGAWVRNTKICHIPKFGVTQGMVRLQSSPCVLRHPQKH